MALGLAMGLHWDAMAVTTPPIIDPGVFKMLLWYDFTDSTQLFQEVDSFTTAADANNDLIGRVKNKAIEQTLFTADDEKIGLFARAEGNNSSRPVFKTGGAGGYSYAQFVSSNANQLETKQDSDYGVHTGTVLKASAFTEGRYSYIIVMDRDDNDNDGDYEVPLSTMFAKDGTTTPVRQEFRINDGGDSYSEGTRDQVTLVTRDNTTSTNLNLPQSLLRSNPVIEVRIGSTAIINPGIGYAPGLMRNARGLNHMEDGTSGITGGLTGLQTYNAVSVGSATFVDYSLKEGSFTGSVKIGDASITTSKFFDGKIYEVILFEQELSQDDMNGLSWYFAQKYGIDIQAENE